jgi:hypothetical protein
MIWCVEKRNAPYPGYQRRNPWLVSFCRETRKVLSCAAFSRPTYQFRLPSPQRGRGAGGEGDSHAVTVCACLPASGRALRERFGNRCCVPAPSPPKPLSPLRRGEPTADEHQSSPGVTPHVSRQKLVRRNRPQRTQLPMSVRIQAKSRTGIPSAACALCRRLVLRSRLTRLSSTSTGPDYGAS